MSVADDFAFNAEFMTPPTPVSAARTEPLGADAPHPEAPRSERRASPATDQPAAGASTQPPIHRLAEVRRQQGISIRSAARRMGVPMAQVRVEEQPDSDLSLADLVRWQRALEVPLADLILDEDSPLSSPVVSRARWLRLMKTVKALLEASPSEPITRMVEMLERQVLEVMPELKDVGAWHSVGQRRTQDEVGRIAESPVASTFARDGLQ